MNEQEGQWANHQDGGAVPQGVHSPISKRFVPVWSYAANFDIFGEYKYVKNAMGPMRAKMLGMAAIQPVTTLKIALKMQLMQLDNPGQNTALRYPDTPGTSINVNFAPHCPLNHPI